MDSKHVWPAVALVALVVAAVVALAYARLDLASIKDVINVLVLPLMLALIGGGVAAVRHNTNGNTSELLRQNARLLEIVASLPPSPLAVPDREGAAVEPAHPPPVADAQPPWASPLPSDPLRATETR